MNSQPDKARFSRRVYALLLFVYPRHLRRQFGDEMTEVFAEHLRDACQCDGWLGGFRVWSCVGMEVLGTAVSAHLQIVGISFVSALTALLLLCGFFWAMHM
ncbi:MAG TPA: hypothetical protein VMA71_09915 [Alloacidobacterium sp.]|nr:hypothetical protein [Alloacidobacterium sp.]